MEPWHPNDRKGETHETREATEVQSLLEMLHRTRMSKLIAEAWSLVGEDDKRKFAREILEWAAHHLEHYSYREMVRQAIGGLIEAKLLDNYVQHETKLELAEALTRKAIYELNTNSFTGRDLVQDALVEAARREMANIAREKSLAELESDK